MALQWTSDRAFIRPAAHRRGHARWRLPMEPCNSAEFCCEDGPGPDAQEKDALWRPWRGNEQAGSEAHSERSRDGGGVSVPGPCGLRTATGGITLGLDVGCSAGPPPARAPRPLGCRPLAQRHAFARLLGRLGRTQGRQLLRLRAGVCIHHFIVLRTGCTVCPSPAQAARSRAAKTTVVRMTRIPHQPTPRL